VRKSAEQRPQPDRDHDLPGQLCQEQLQNGHRLRLFLDRVTPTTISE
jgi:hypothetical protein